MFEQWILGIKFNLNIWYLSHLYNCKIHDIWFLHWKYMMKNIYNYTRATCNLRRYGTDVYLCHHMKYLSNKLSLKIRKSIWHTIKYLKDNFHLKFVFKKFWIEVIFLVSMFKCISIHSVNYSLWLSFI